MKELALHIDYYVSLEGGLASVDLAEVHRRINRIPLKPIDYDFAVERLKELLSSPGAA